jgi:glycosyltransferase involved in cell wall biosynthesis
VVELILKVLLLGLQYVFLIGNIFLLRNEFSKHRMDVLHIVNGGYPGGVSCRAAAIAARHSSRVLIIMSVLSYPSRYLFWPLERVVDSVVGRCVDAFITNSTASAYAMVTSRHFRARKVDTVHTGVKKNCRDWTLEAHAIRTQFAIPPCAKIVGSVAAFQPYKGQCYLLDTIPAIRDRFPSVKYMLVGDGETKKDLEEVARSRGLTPTVVFTGYYPADVRGIISAFDVFVLPSVYEGLPYVVLEAMSLAKPVIATDVAGIPEQVENGVSGILVPSRDPGLLTDAIARLLGNEQEAQRMGIEARKRVERHFSVEDMLWQFDVLYGRLSP